MWRHDLYKSEFKVLAWVDLSQTEHAYLVVDKTMPKRWYTMLLRWLLISSWQARIAMRSVVKSWS